ncbi:MAG TPA: DUF4097 family beta strand repeat-containing protein [Myxococcaceae bacterium]|nr:DUF4097 family beta strand repeat-containing protein [Myxococcaceae bacterium]
MQSAILMLALAATAQSWEFKTGPKANVSVTNVDGSITVQGSAREDVVVEATVSEGSGWTVDAHADGADVKVRACCGSCDGNGNRCHSGKVDFVLKVPEGSNLKATSVNAEISVTGVAGAQNLTTVSGRIDSSGSASNVDVHSVSGDVRLSPNRLAETKANTVSGDVQIKLPASADAKVRLSTVSGKLNGQKVGIGTGDKTFGNGAVAVKVTTVSGSVEAQPSP